MRIQHFSPLDPDPAQLRKEKNPDSDPTLNRN